MIRAKVSSGGLLVGIRAVPNAKKTGAVGIYNGMLKVKVSAPPEDGKANREIIEFMAGMLGIRKKDIEIVKGEKSREKTLLIGNISLDKFIEITGGSNAGTENKDK
jgi:uncharacterized protein (TIGR00251 family)